ncbi:RagB/SusD family nutrient uptake outer membrane protein [Flavivirga aquimarina]|uniref:RagB/SusD family nutrient uptake outer membrane protein n=1 Tax=Flavivirga aquimarina TaxID=2027862 RepID=A0ABT8W8I6_9FLAO|nr:RagB/SusD family nutrient uptake outer membrane protein [Flavivirga aquimarina]MDO5969401.1 RagB/SusD family nutrient uptake outer membrane protein [Flavivirga aquimarina]
MKHIYKIVLALLIILNFYSCDEFLELKPKGEFIPREYEDYVFLLNDPNLINQLELGYVNLFTDDLEKLVDSGLPLDVGFNDTPEFGVNYYYFNSGPTHPQDENDEFFTSSYQQIYTYDFVASDVMEVTDASEEEKLAVRAEALFGRAYNYFKLINLYAKAYDPATASTDYGVPLILESNIYAEYGRNSVEEVYNQIINDLLEATSSLPVTASSNYHPTKASGYLLLAKVYLFMGEFDTALTYANLALDNKETFELQDLKKYIAGRGEWEERIKNETTKELMEEMVDISENMYIKKSLTNFDAMAFATEELVAIYEKDLPSGSIDKRRELYFDTDRSEFQIFAFIDFPGKTLFASFVRRNVGMSLPDLYLILAEAEARVGSKDKAMEYINYLRDYRITNNVPLTVATNEEALIKVLEERRREFSFRSDFRFVDLKRLNKEPAFAKTITHTIKGVDYTLPPNDPRYILPLSNDVIQFNPDMPLYDR